MASSLLVRSSSKLLSSSAVAQNAVRVAAFSSAGGAKNVKWVMNDPVDHATGVEKYELLQKMLGNDDPFFLKSMKRGKGTKDEPNIVDSYTDFRFVGCVCNENDTNIKWQIIMKDRPKRCMCGYWFKLKKHEPVNINEFNEKWEKVLVKRRLAEEEIPAK